MRIVVLNDSETFTAAAGCRILEVNDNASTEAIESSIKEMDTILSNGGGYIFGPGEILEHHVGWFDDDGILLVTDVDELEI